MTRAKLAVGLVSIVALLATTAPAHADDPVTAEALFKEGRALLEKGRIDEACDRFMRSEQLDPAVGTLINVGECFEHTKQYASAWGAFREAANLAMKRNDARAALARDKAAHVEPRIARLTIAIDPLPAGVAVTRNNTRVDVAALNTAIPVDPGPQAIGVTAPGRKPWQGKLELREGETDVLRVPNLESLPTEEAPLPPRPPAEEKTPTQSKVALGLEIGGGVALATGLVFGALTLSAWSSVQDTCPSGRCPTTADRDRLDGDQQRASTFGAVSTVTTIIGSAAILAGIVLHLTAPSRSASVSAHSSKQ